MREILFRGKTKDGVWYHGFIKGKSLPNFQGNKLEFTHCIIEQPYADIWVIPETVGQYTGLIDKNGKKIFEGDIVTVEGFVEIAFIVIYYNGGFKLKEIGSEDLFAYYITETMCEEELIEIIGNVHENPDLMKGGGDNA